MHSQTRADVHSHETFPETHADEYQYQLLNIQFFSSYCNGNNFSMYA